MCYDCALEKTREFAPNKATNKSLLPTSDVGNDTSEIKRVRTTKGGIRGSNENTGSHFSEEISTDDLVDLDITEMAFVNGDRFYKRSKDSGGCTLRKAEEKYICIKAQGETDWLPYLIICLLIFGGMCLVVLLLILIITCLCPN